MSLLRSPLLLIRLLLAALVAVSHCWDLLGLTEPARAMGLPFSLGGIAVDGFFLISGWLVTLSWERDPRGYFGKRVRRIYPGFLACAALCAFVVAPLTGAHIEGWPKEMLRTLVLKFPAAVGAFPASPYPVLDGSAWSILYEFRCYLLAALLGALGFYRRPALLMTATIALAAAWGAHMTWPHELDALIGEPAQTLRLTAIFFFGAVLRIVTRLKIPEVRGAPDISYGLYLYAWPVTQLLILAGLRAPVMLSIVTIALAAGVGALSWFLVEKPAMKWRLLMPVAGSARPLHAGNRHG